MKKLFDFQESFLQSCLDFFDSKGKDSALAIAPTGMGKSVIIAKLSSILDGNLLFIVPSVDLLRQNEEAIRSEGGDVGIYCGSLNRKEVKKITLATSMSLKDGELFKNLGFNKLIVDEAHYKCSEDGSFKSFLDGMKPTKVLGLTATGFKSKNSYGFQMLITLDKVKPNIFKKIIHVTQVSEVIKANRWSNVKYENYAYDVSGLQFNSDKTDYTEDSIISNNEYQNINRSLCLRIKDILVNDPKSKSLIFTDCVKTASIISEWVKSRFNVGCAFIDANTNKTERGKLVSEFKSEDSNTNILINFGTFTTGLDCPNLKYCILARPTLSFVLYYQIVGRVVRKHPEKEFGVFIDFCGNINRFGYIEDIEYRYLDGFGWCVFSGGRLMTGVPIYSNKIITEDMLMDPPKLKSVDYSYKMPFGKFEGYKVISLKKWYRDFLIKECDLTNHIQLKQILLDMEENDFNKLLLRKKRG